MMPSFERDLPRRTRRVSAPLSALVVFGLSAASAAAADNPPATVDPRVHVVFPLETQPPPPAGLQSSASYRVSTDCPPGTSRWREPQEWREVSFEIASQLVVLVEPVSDPQGATAAPPATVFTDAGNAIAAVLSLRAPVVEPDAPVPDAAALLASWETGLSDASSSAARLLAGAVAGAGESGATRVRVLVVRERVVARCGAIESCVGGRWQAAGHRAADERREPLPPLALAPVTVERADAAAAEAQAYTVVNSITEWLHPNYAAAAARATAYALARDPCDVAVAPPAAPASVD
jgi:hypothetical protein